MIRAIQILPAMCSSLLLVAATAAHASAQVREAWTQTTNGGFEDLGASAVVGANGTTYVTGKVAVQPFSGNVFTMRTMAYAPNGTLIWSRDYTSPVGGSSYPFSIAFSSQGDLYVGGVSELFGPGVPYAVRQTLVKYSASGTLLWAHEYGSLEGLAGNAVIAVDAQDSVFMGGGQYGASGTTDLCVRKVDSSGVEQWAATYDGGHPGPESLRGIALAPNGDVVATGYTRSVNGYNLAVMRVDASGNVLWEREPGSGAGIDGLGLDVAVDAAGNAYAAGSFSTSQDASDQALVALDPAGALLWMKNIDGGPHQADSFQQVELDPFGRIVAAGTQTVSTGPDANVKVFDTAGNLVWSRAFDGPLHQEDTFLALALDALGDIHVAGYTDWVAWPMTQIRGFAIEYDPSGDERFQHVHLLPGGPTNDYYYDIATGADGSIALVGSTANSTTIADDMLVVRLERTATPYCFGDGSGATCPCGNASAPVLQAGCLSSLGLAGRLIDSGASSLSADTFVLNGTNMTPSACLYFQGTITVAGGSGAAFGDGLRCAGGVVVRLATKQNVSGESRYPETGDAPVSVRGGIASPGERTYQVWYRNAASFCTSSTFNLTNGLRVSWFP